MTISTITFLTSISLLAVYVAWNLGANDVANSMGTSVGSKAITLTQAIIIAGIMEFTGAMIFGQRVSATLATKVADPNLFIDQPETFTLGMIAVLLSCGMWLQIATSQGLPVASSHAGVGAIAGFSWIAKGKDAIAWETIGKIALGWLVTPVISAMVAACIYGLLRYWLFEREDLELQLREWIPWLSAALISIFGIIVLPSIVEQPVFRYLYLPEKIISLGIGVLATGAITFYSWYLLDRSQQQKDNSLSTGLEKQGKAESLLDSRLEKIMGKFQVFSACFVAFAHGSNDVGNAIAPLAAMIYIFQTNTMPRGDLTIPAGILFLGSVGIVAGLAVQGKKVITTVGENIVSLAPSTGFCAEIATATTILIASRIGLPVSTSHALVGSIIGIGLMSRNQQIRWSTINSVVLAWVITLPVAAVFAAGIFSLSRYFF